MNIKEYLHLISLYFYFYDAHRGSLVELDPLEHNKPWLDLPPAKLIFKQFHDIEDIDGLDLSEFENLPGFKNNIQKLFKKALPLDGEPFIQLQKALMDYHNIPKVETYEKVNSFNETYQAYRVPLERKEKLYAISQQVESILSDNSNELTDEQRTTLKSIATIAKNKNQYLEDIENIFEKALIRAFKAEVVDGQPMVVCKSLDLFDDLDPCHRRYDFNFIDWQNELDSKPNLPNFWLWLENQSWGLQANMTLQPGHFIDLETKRITVKNGKCYNEEITSSQNPLSGSFLYAVSAKNKIYILPKDISNFVNDDVNEQSQSPTHNFILNGQSVKTAGFIDFEDGKIVTMDNKSGHYRPTALTHMSVVKELRELLDVFSPEAKILFEGKPSLSLTDVIEDNYNHDEYSSLVRDLNRPGMVGGHMNLSKEEIAQIRKSAVAKNEKRLENKYGGLWLSKINKTRSTIGQPLTPAPINTTFQDAAKAVAEGDLNSLKSMLSEGLDLKKTSFHDFPGHSEEINLLDVALQPILGTQMSLTEMDKKNFDHSPRIEIIKLLIDALGVENYKINGVSPLHRYLASVPPGGPDPEYDPIVINILELFGSEALNDTVGYTNWNQNCKTTMELLLSRGYSPDVIESAQNLGGKIDLADLIRRGDTQLFQTLMNQASTTTERHNIIRKP